MNVLIPFCQEDAHAAVLDVDELAGQPTGTGYFGVFDGHGGKEVAKFAAKYLVSPAVQSLFLSPQPPLISLPERKSGVNPCADQHPVTVSASLIPTHVLIWPLKAQRGRQPVLACCRHTSW